MEATQTSSIERVQHSSHAPVMMIGYGSSGTSIASKLLRDYLQIGIGTETQFIVRYHERLSRYGDLTNDENLRRLVTDIASERWFDRGRKFGYQVDAEAIIEDVQTKDYRGVLDAIFRQFATQLGTTRWGDKTPEYIYHLPVIGKLFPEANYIHMVRDGRDVTNSVMNRYWGSKNAYVGATVWREGVAFVDTFVAGLPDEQKIEIRYEDLLQDPVSTFARLITFLEIDDPDEVLLESIRQRVNQDLNRRNFDKWKAWPESDRIRFERVACDLLQRHGYETLLENTDNTFPFWERAFWRVHNKVLKWTYPRYWQDNVYRVSLRLADGWRWLRHKLRIG